MSRNIRSSVKVAVGVFILAVFLAGFPADFAIRTIQTSKLIDESVMRGVAPFANRFLTNRAQANPGTRSRTVSFYIGTFATNGTNATLKALNATNTLPDASSFTFGLAEGSVVVQDAYIDWTVHFNASGTATQATDLFMQFDACVDPCTPNAWATSNIASTSATTDYFSNSGESDVGNFKMDVTNEPQLATYTGGSTLRGQFGYCIGTDAAAPIDCGGAATVAAQIGYVTGVLHVTYTYDDTSPSYTNTVTYPLESNTAGDSGSKKAFQAAGCTLGSNCPTFTYNVAVPEFSASSSQWFALNGAGNPNGATDYTATVRVGTGAQSQTQVFEEARSANDFGMAFLVSSVAGLTVNTTSTLERTGTGNTMHTLGGEVFETYFASSSAATKTRTIRLPYGEICATQVATLCTATTSVSFPESGVVIKKAWHRIAYSESSATAATLTASTRIGSNATTTNVYNIATSTLAAVQQDLVYDVIASSTYTTMATATPANPITVLVGTTYSAARGATSGELMITYTYTGESAGYNVSQWVFAGNSNNDNNVSTSTMSTTSPIIPETSGVRILRGGLRASFLGMDSDLAPPADHGGTANTQMALGANMVASGSCTSTAAFSSLPDNGTEDNTVLLYKNVTATLTTSTSQTYTPCYVDRMVISDNTAGFQVSGDLIVTYAVDIVLNSPPTLSALTLNGGSAITLTENTSTSIAVVGTATDLNGNADISFATGTIYRSGISGGAACTSDENNCYRVASSSCVKSNCSGNSCDFTCTAKIQYFADPTDSGTFSAENWLGEITATDIAGTTGVSTTASGVELNTLFSLNVTSALNFGSLSPGGDSGTVNQVATTTNTGNAAIDAELSGENMVFGANTITVGNEKYATSTFTYSSCTICTALTTTPTRYELDLPKPTSTASVEDTVFWGLGVPNGNPPGSYTGTSTFTGIAD